MLYIPEGFAHGFQTLEGNTEVFYQMSAFYVSQSARGIRWNDTEIGIVWPETANRIVSIRDQNYNLLISEGKL
jgi:dTDP-4-dehydrorhamnose 3,5-epimerase